MQQHETMKPLSAAGLIDSHCHLDLEPLCGNLHQVVAEARMAGVTEFVVPGVHPANWERIAALAEQDVGIHAACGIHPMHAALATDHVLIRLADMAQHAVAIGEIGLDPLYSVSLEQQEQAFRAQLRLARELNLPLLIHCRRAFQRTLTIMREESTARVGGIMHAFSGSWEMAREFIRLGFAISLSGTLTWDNAVRPLRLAREVPLEHLVLETDAPDMPPQRFRGQPNRPAWLMETARLLADLRGVELTEVIHTSRQTTLRALRLPHSVNG